MNEAITFALITLEVKIKRKKELLERGHFLFKQQDQIKKDISLLEKAMEEIKEKFAS